MTVALIHGFKHSSQVAKPEWGNITVTEVVLIQTTSPTVTQIEILNALPGAPNAVTSTNPKGISFTFDVSEHPEASALILRSAGELKQVEESGCFWEIQLTYSIFSTFEVVVGGGGGAGKSTNPKKRKDQREVQNPLDRPVVWSCSTAVVLKDTYEKEDGTGPILHANDLPLTSPYKYEETHESHSFSYNVDFDDFDHTYYRSRIGKVDSGGIFGATAKRFKLASYSANEEYESIQIQGDTGISKTEYHYVRVTLVFEYNPSGWDVDAEMVSMHTLQIGINGYDPILVSPTQYATEPWPLVAGGQGAPYNALDPTDFVLVDHGYPRTMNLTSMASDYDLVIP